MDLFITKKEQLKRWMREKVIFATHDVINWGTRNFYNRAAQTKGDFHTEGIIRRLGTSEKKMHGYKCKDDVYIWI